MNSTAATVSVCAPAASPDSIETVAPLIPRIVAIEGNIGAGKTTIFESLKTRLAHLGTRVLFMPEPVDLWQTVADESGETALAKFYRDPTKYAFSFQIMAYSSRLAMLRRLIRENPDCELVVCERSLEADRNIFAKLLYAEGNMESVEFQIYEMLFRDTAPEFPLSAAVYIDADPEVCSARIAKRSRNGESSIALDYLEKCHDHYDAWLLDPTTTFPMLRIDTNAEASYSQDDAEDCGNKWVEQIVAFLKL
jgi:deoxyadenosine/deoxycytidine kinase